MNYDYNIPDRRSRQLAASNSRALVVVRNPVGVVVPLCTVTKLQHSLHGGDKGPSSKTAQTPLRPSWFLGFCCRDARCRCGANLGWQLERRTSSSVAGSPSVEEKSIWQLERTVFRYRDEGEESVSPGGRRGGKSLALRVAERRGRRRNTPRNDELEDDPGTAAIHDMRRATTEDEKSVLQGFFGHVEKQENDCLEDHVDPPPTIRLESRPPSRGTTCLRLDDEPPTNLLDSSEGASGSPGQRKTGDRRSKHDHSVTSTSTHQEVDLWSDIFN